MYKSELSELLFTASSDAATSDEEVLKAASSTLETVLYVLSYKYHPDTPS